MDQRHFLRQLQFTAFGLSVADNQVWFFAMAPNAALDIEADGSNLWLRPGVVMDITTRKGRMGLGA